MALPNSNISVAMVKSELGAATNNVGQLCIHPNINKWSKWKPVKHNSLTPITQAQLEDVDFGLKPPEPKTDYTLVMDEKWEYLKPTGGLSSPYRLSDFTNYDKSAGAIAYVPDPGKKLHIDKSRITSRDISLLMNTSESDFIIGLGDFIGDIGGYYYGAVIEERTNRYIITSDKTLANGGFSFTLDFTQSPFDTLREDYTIRHLLISKSSPTIQRLGNFGAAYYMPIPTADGEVNFTEMTVSTRPSGDIGVNFTHVGTGTLPQFPISNYQSIDGASMQTSGDLYLRAQLTNHTDSTKIFQYPNEIGISPTFFGDTYRGAIQIYYQGVLQTNAQISVPSSSTIELVMGNTNLINRQNNDIATPPTGVEIFPVINLYRNNYRISGTSLKLKS